MVKKEIPLHEKNIETISRIIEKGGNHQFTPEAAEAYLAKQKDLLQLKQKDLDFFVDQLTELGGFDFHQGNIKKGDLVEISRWEGSTLRVTATGKVNFSYVFVEERMKNQGGKEVYADIIKKIES